MKKKGFTITELLAVIVVLSIIGLIIVPKIADVLKNARMATAKNSVHGYIDAINNKLSSNIINDESMDGTISVSDLESEIKYSGNRVKSGIVTISDNKVTEAKLCIDDFSLRYYNGEIDPSKTNYCLDRSNIEIAILGNTTTQELRNKFDLDLDLTSYDITDATHVICNNDAVPSMDGNTLHIDNIYGDTKCSVESNIATTFSNLYDTTNNIVMIKDISITGNLIAPESHKLVLNLNGKNMSVNMFYVYGDFEVFDSKKTGEIITKNNAFNMTSKGSELVLRDINITSDTIGMWISSACSNCTASIYDTNINATTKGMGINGNATNSKINVYGNTVVNSVQACVEIGGESNNADINGGTYISDSLNGIINSSKGTINITQTDTPIYITSHAQIQKPAIYNTSTGTINISASKANACTSNPDATTSGLCVYAEGDGSYATSAGNIAIMNGQGTLNIEGGTYYGGYIGITNYNGNSATKGNITVSNASISSAGYGINDNSGGQIDIINTDIVAGHNNAVDNNKGGIINITDSSIRSDAKSAIRNTSTGTVNITQENKPMYVTSLAQELQPVIANHSTGTINITANKANACTSNASDTTSGLCVYADGNGDYTTNAGNTALRNHGTGTTNINGGTYNATSRGLINDSTGKIIIRNASVISRGYGIYNNAGGQIDIYETDSYSVNNAAVCATGDFDTNLINIYSGKFISELSYSVLNNKAGVINITQTDKPIYISSLIHAWKPAVVSNSTGVVNITANKANACTSNPSDTTSGLCVYVTRDEPYSSSTSNVAVAANSGTIVGLNINGGTYHGGQTAISTSGKHVNIKNAEIISMWNGILTTGTGIINICSSTVNAPNRDMANNDTGTINYASDVTFSNGTNTPDSAKIYNPSGTINAVGTCPISE